MYFYLLSIIFSIISITLLWYDAIHDATCIPVNVYIVIHDIMLYVIHYAMYGAIHEKYMMQYLDSPALPL